MGRDIFRNNTPSPIWNYPLLVFFCFIFQYRLMRKQIRGGKPTGNVDFFSNRSCYFLRALIRKKNYSQ